MSPPEGLRPHLTIGLTRRGIACEFGRNNEMLSANNNAMQGG